MKSDIVGLSESDLRMVSLAKSILQRDDRKRNVFWLTKEQTELSSFIFELIRDPRVLQNYLAVLGKEGYYSVFNYLEALESELSNSVADLATFDPKTNLYNSLAFDILLRGNLQSYASGQLRDVPEAILDIDNFKTVNEKFGYSAGDKALISVARIVREHVGVSPRPRDFAAILEHEQAGRFGGEEIIIVYPNKPLKAASEKLDDLRSEIEEYFFKNKINGKQGLTVSIGLQSAKNCERVNRFTGAPTDLDNLRANLFAQTNSALYVAKRTGKNKVMTFDDAVLCYTDLQPHQKREFREKLHMESGDFKKFRTKYLK